MTTNRRENSISRILANAARKTLCMLLTAIMAVTLTSYNISYAADDPDEPVREVHRVTVENKKYCCFVTHNVVLTPSEIEAMTDNELVTEILSRAGMYMKEANCRKASHSSMTAKAWVKRGGSFALKDNDIEALRSASPSSGAPVKFYIDLGISTDPYIEEQIEPSEEEQTQPSDGEQTQPGDGEQTQPSDGKQTQPADGGETQPSDGGQNDPADSDQTQPADGGEIQPSDGEQTQPADSGETQPSDDGQTQPADGEQTDPADGETEPQKDSEDKVTPAERKIFSTYKLLSPSLLFIAVATEGDAAAAAEDQCAEEKSDSGKKAEKQAATVKDPGKGGGEPAETLPEYKTISMVDRSGPKLEKTLEDGTPVTLEWIEPSKASSNTDSSFLRRIPGGVFGLAGLASALIAAIAIILIRSHREEEE